MDENELSSLIRESGKPHQALTPDFTYDANDS